MISNNNNSNATGIIPSDNHLVVKKNENDNTVTVGQTEFVLPKDYHQKPMECTVVEVGNITESEMKPSVGDVVLLSKYGSTKVMVENEEYHLCNIKDVIGVL